MAPKGKNTTVPCVIFERLLPGPIERVWTHLTQPQLVPDWFGADAVIEPRAGGAVRLAGGHIRGIVTQWQPPTRLVYTWNVFSPEDGPDAVSAYPESYPTFELQEEGGDVKLTFRHFPILERFVPQNAMGWHVMLDLLTAALAGEKAEPRSVYTERASELYGVDLSNLAR